MKIIGASLSLMCIQIFFYIYQATKIIVGTISNVQNLKKNRSEHQLTGTPKCFSFVDKS